jgi:hypothetical protein
MGTQFCGRDSFIVSRWAEVQKLKHNLTQLETLKKTSNFNRKFVKSVSILNDNDSQLSKRSLCLCLPGYRCLQEI